MFSGTLKKMNTEYKHLVRYFLNFDNDFIEINQCIGKKISLQLKGYQCLACKKNIFAIYRQGFCKECFFKIPQAGDWIMRPELSTAHLNIKNRDLEYEKKIQLQPHILYLAFSGNLKVGVTRKSQIPYRWIDQGASAAMSLLEFPNRYLAGKGEVALKNVFQDKTNWRKMLQNDISEINWKEEKEKAIKKTPNDLRPFLIKKENLTTINYPIQKYPLKVNSLKLKKEKSFSSILKGIKGQYLIFENDYVFNIRANEGAVVEMKIYPAQKV